MKEDQRAATRLRTAREHISKGAVTLHEACGEIPEGNERTAALMMHGDLVSVLRRARNLETLLRGEPAEAVR